MKNSPFENVKVINKKEYRSEGNLESEKLKVNSEKK